MSGSTNRPASAALGSDRGDYRVRFGPVWRRRTYKGMRAYGWDFGLFAIVVLLDLEADS